MNRRLSAATYTLVGLLGTSLGGCSPAPPPSGFEASLTHLSGCADVLLVASNAEDSLAVVFQSSGQVMTAQSTGKPMVFPLTLPAAGVSVHLYQGKGIAASKCTDYIVEGQSRIDSDRTASSGSATLTITPSPNADKASLVLQNLMFQQDGDAAIALPKLQINDVHVGWFAG